jgi:hypothetical protein
MDLVKYQQATNEPTDEASKTREKGIKATRR